MSKSETGIERGDIVLTASGRRATVVYVHKRRPHALVKYEGVDERASIPLDSLVKLPESERGAHSVAARARWAAVKKSAA